MERSGKCSNKKGVLSSREQPLNRKHIGELVSLATSLKGKPSEGLRQLQTIYRRARGRPTLDNQVAKVSPRRSYLFRLMSSLFLAYVNLLSGKLDSLNAKADDVLKIIKS